MTVFLILTFAISLVGFAGIVLVPGARSPDSKAGLPCWLLMVWGPSLAALLLAGADGELTDLLTRAIQLQGVPLLAWALVAAPIGVLLVLRPFAPQACQPLGIGTFFVMIGFNLVLGPLGEELGWRGFMQHALAPEWGWPLASLIVGVVWLVWHLPLWVIDSPHAQISKVLFAGHILTYTIIIGGAYSVSGGSILPAILIHLTVNVASNAAVYAGFQDPNSWFAKSLPAYAVLRF